MPLLRSKTKRIKREEVAWGLTIIGMHVHSHCSCRECYFSLFLPVQSKAPKNPQNYVLIFFSDMNLDPAPVLYTKGKDAIITSTSHFRTDDLKNFTQMTVHLNFETSPNVYPTYIVIINLNGKTLVNHICSRPLKDYEITVGTDLLKKGINDVDHTNDPRHNSMVYRDILGTSDQQLSLYQQRKIFSSFRRNN